MKTNILLGLLFLLILNACSEEEKFKIVYPALSSDLESEAIVLSAKSAENVFAIFYWTRGDFNDSSISPEYVLEMDIKGNNFASPHNLIKTHDLSYRPKNKEINQALIDLGVAAGESADLEFRITYTNDGQKQAAENVIDANVTPYELVLTYPKLYVTGDHNSWGFDGDNALFSVFNDEIYEGYIYTDGGSEWAKFKMSTQPNWDNGDVIIGDADGSGTSGVLQIGNWGGNEIYATEGAGVYYIQADIPGLAYTIYKTDWAVTGNFNSWGFTDMIYDIDTDTWSLTADLTAGGFKFIANQDWNIVKGDNELDGILDPGTDENNIRIDEDGNYTITLNLSEAIYTYTIDKN